MSWIVVPRKANASAGRSRTVRCQARDCKRPYADHLGAAETPLTVVNTVPRGSSAPALSCRLGVATYPRTNRVRVLVRCGKCPSWQSHSAAIRSSIGSRCFIPNGGRYGRGHSGPPKLPNLFVLCDRYRAANLSYCMSVVGREAPDSVPDTGRSSQVAQGPSSAASTATNHGNSGPYAPWAAAHTSRYLSSAMSDPTPPADPIHGPSPTQESQPHA
jgi:hypothetical protein